MKLDVLKLPYTKVQIQEDEINFDPEVFKCHKPLIEVKKCNVETRSQRFEEFIYVTISLKAKVVLECSYTLQHFLATVNGTDELHFAPSKDEDEDCIEYRGTSIDLDPYIFNLLSASVPLSPKAPNAKSPLSGNGYRVLSEDEFLKEKEGSTNSQFDVLKDLEFNE